MVFALAGDSTMTRGFAMADRLSSTGAVLSNVAADAGSGRPFESGAPSGHTPAMPTTGSLLPGTPVAAPRRGRSRRRARPWGTVRRCSTTADDCKVKRHHRRPRPAAQLPVPRAAAASTGSIVRGHGPGHPRRRRPRPRPPAQAIDIPLGGAHRMTNPGADELVFVEVQLGDYFGEDDIVRYSDDYGRARRRLIGPGPRGEEPMDFELSPKAQDLQARLLDFMDSHVYPAEQVYRDQMAASGDPHHHPPVIEVLKARGPQPGGCGTSSSPTRPQWTEGLSNVDYAALAEIMGRSPLASEACNCSAPDTGNMEILTMFGTPDAAGAVAPAAARGRDPLVLRHDRAGGGLQRRHQHRVLDRARRRRLRDQRAQVVDLRSRLAPLPGGHRHGQDQPRRAPPPPAVDGAGAHGHARA